jgi:hypothetical protein
MISMRPFQYNPDCSEVNLAVVDHLMQQGMTLADASKYASLIHAENMDRLNNNEQTLLSELSKRYAHIFSE